MKPSDREMYNLNPKSLGIYSQTECEYFATFILKYKLESEANEATTNESRISLEEYRDKIQNTIYVLNSNMVKPEVSTDGILTFYNQLTPDNIIKLFRHGKGLYEARD